MESIERILKNHYVDGIYHTHTSMIEPLGRFQFNRNDIEIFWELYCDKIYNEKDPIVGITEKSQQYIPILVDVDIKMEESKVESKIEHLYTEDNVLELVQTYQSILRNIIENISDENLTCILLEKPIYYIDKGSTTYCKNGFHLHFPNLFLNKNDIQNQLLPRVIESIKTNNLFSNIDIEDKTTLIDKSVCSNNWLLYGSRKQEDMEPYKVSKVYNSECREISLEEAFKHYKIYDNNENRINIRNKVEYYLPRILSIFPYGRDNMELKSNLPLPMKEKVINERRQERKQCEIKQSSEEKLKIASKLLPMISTFRSREYSEWINIGFALYNIGEGSNQALDLWLEFSERAEECYDEEGCIYQWERMIAKEDGLTLGTLRYLAMKDSPEEYKKYKQEKSQEYLQDSLNGSHNDIAKALYEEFGDIFVCSSVPNKTWYQFREHRWEEIESGVFLRQQISSHIANRFNRMGKDILHKLSLEEDKANEDALNAKLKLIQKMNGNCKSSPFKNNVMNECMEVFYDRKFKEKLNQNPYLIGFKNGVYDLKLNIFRDGRTDDCISKCLPINYKEFQHGDSEVQLVIDFLMKVFPDESIRTYFLDMYSDLFVGGNTQKVVLFWTGEGDNGKSITQNILEEMLGELAIKFDTTLFSGKKTGLGSASPELARAEPPVRLATMEEPDRNEELNIGYLKKLSGGDKYWARDLFEKGKSTREVKPMFMLTFICNALPKLKHSDQATWNRIRVIPFESTFVKNKSECPDTFEEQMQQKRFLRDSEFSTKIPKMLEAFAWYLLEWRKKITIRIEPPKVREATEIYRRQNDMYRQFNEECLIQDENARISLIELYSQFKDWFKESFPNMSLPVKNDVKEHFDKLYDFRNSKYEGIRIKTIRDQSLIESKVEVIENQNE